MYKELIKAGIQESVAKKIINYFDSMKSDPKSPKNNDDDLFDLALKYYAVGLPLDGVNVAVSGYKRAFITWIGYKTKVQTIYPEAEFDVQVVKKSDIFSFEKNSGEVTYHHKITNPFVDEEIIGAYAFIKTNTGQNIEFLDRPTFEKMKASGAMKALWEKWESEFWLKSIVKRVCKRRFHDVVKEIEDLDNEDYDLNNNQSTGKVSVTRKSAMTEQINDAINFLREADNLKELSEKWAIIDLEVKRIPEVAKEKNELKAGFSEIN